MRIVVVLNLSDILLFNLSCLFDLMRHYLSMVVHISLEA